MRRSGHACIPPAISNTHTCPYRRRYILLHTHMHRNVYMYAYMYMHMHIHTHTHTHSLSFSLCPYPPPPSRSVCLSLSLSLLFLLARLLCLSLSLSFSIYGTPVCPHGVSLAPLPRVCRRLGWTGTCFLGRIPSHPAIRAHTETTTSVSISIHTCANLHLFTVGSKELRRGWRMIQAGCPPAFGVGLEDGHVPPVLDSTVCLYVHISKHTCIAIYTCRHSLDIEPQLQACPGAEG